MLTVCCWERNTMMVFGLLSHCVWMLLMGVAALTVWGEGPHLQRLSHWLVCTTPSAMFLLDTEETPWRLPSPFSSSTIWYLPYLLHILSCPFSFLQIPALLLVPYGSAGKAQWQSWVGVLGLPGRAMNESPAVGEAMSSLEHTKTETEDVGLCP